MKTLDVLTKLVIGMGRFGDHLLSRKVSGTLVAALAFACGASLAYALRAAPRAKPAAAPSPVAVAPARAGVTVRDTFAHEAAGSPRRVEGRYNNDVYGFHVRLPAGVVGSGSTPPAPDRGFGIDLDNPRSTAWNGRGLPKSYLYVGASDSPLESEERERHNAVNSHLKSLREKGRDVRVRSCEETMLGDVHAVRVVALYEEDGAEMVSDAVVTLVRNDDAGVMVLYTLALSTPLSKYERDRPVFEAVCEGFYLHPRC